MPLILFGWSIYMVWSISVPDLLKIKESGQAGEVG